MKLKVIISMAIVTLLAASPAFALPALQLGPGNGSWVYDTTDQTWKTDTNPFSLFAYANATAANGGNGNYAWDAAGIVLRPMPRSASWTLYMHYIPAMTEMTLGTHTFDGINGWEEFAVLDAAMKCSRKDNDTETLALLKPSRDEQLVRLNRMAANRDQARPYHIQDTNGDWFNPRRTRRGNDNWSP